MFIGVSVSRHGKLLAKLQQSVITLILALKVSLSLLEKKKRLYKLSKMKMQLLKECLDNHTKWSQGRSFSR